MKLKPNYIFSAEDKLTDQRQIVKFKISKITENSKHLPEIISVHVICSVRKHYKIVRVVFFSFQKIRLASKSSAYSTFMY